MRTLEAVVEPSGRIVLELPGYPVGQRVKLIIEDADSVPGDSEERRLALARIFSDKRAWASEHPELVRSDEQILRDLRAERDAWGDED